MKIIFSHNVLRSVFRLASTAVCRRYAGLQFAPWVCISGATVIGILSLRCG